MVTDLELDDLGSPRTFEMSGKLCEEPTHGRASTLQAKDDSAVFIARLRIPRHPATQPTNIRPPI
ncbi:MAG: hypothetical protein V4600_29795, partial [Pseudomonadota bacterium]